MTSHLFTISDLEELPVYFCFCDCSTGIHILRLPSICAMVFKYTCNTASETKYRKVAQECQCKKCAKKSEYKGMLREKCKRARVQEKLERVQAREKCERVRENKYRRMPAGESQACMGECQCRGM